MTELEELQAIIDNAPEGATHYDCNIYYKRVGEYIMWTDNKTWHWQDEGEEDVMRSLSDIKRIIELLKESK